MKKLLLSLFSLFLIVGVSYGQAEAEKAYKKATRALGAYHLDQTNNEAKLDEAIDLIEKAIQGDEVKMMAKAWIARGEIYNAMAGKLINPMFVQGLTGEEEFVLSPEASTSTMEAVRSFKKALEKAEKKAETKEALRGLAESASYLNTVGNEMLRVGDYASAFEPLMGVLDVNQVVTGLGDPPVLPTEEDVNNTRYVVAFCASAAGEDDKAAKMFEELIASDYEESGIYSGYANLLMRQEGMEVKTEEVLGMGRAKFPDNTDILFAEINFFLRQDRLEVLVDKLTAAIEKEPNNASLYSTLGNVYDNLFQRELEAGNEELGSEYFDNALSYYSMALEKKPDYVEAVYSVGALYFNKAASVSKKLIELEDDLSPAGQRAYEGTRAEMLDLFDDALPFFKTAEKMDPNDINTMIALKEIFARKDDIVTSNEFKKRIEAIQAGEVLETSFFNE